MEQIGKYALQFGTVGASAWLLTKVFAGGNSNCILADALKGFFDSIFHNVGNVVSTVSHAILGGVSKVVCLVQHAIPKVVDFARKAIDNLVNVGKQVVGKASECCYHFI